jgi:hypothetical protein
MWSARTEDVDAARKGAGQIRNQRVQELMKSTHTHDTIALSRAEIPIVDLLLALLDDFHRQNISYCYWKSSRRVHSVLTGAGDLDVLIARGDQHRAQRILLERGCKLFPSLACRDHPAVLSFLGYDEPSGRIVHFHLHFRLVVGEPLLKNYRLPWEETILTRAIPHPTLPIRMLDPASEALLLVVRACLEQRQVDPLALRNRRATKHKFALDRGELAARVDRSQLRNLAAELLDEDLAGIIADALYSQRAFEGDGRLRRRIQKHVAPYRAYNAAEARLRSSGRAFLWLAGSLNRAFLRVPRPWSRRAPGGGVVAAVLGVDGSGKTTVVAAIRAWLGAEVDVVPIYLGTGGGRPSLLLLPLKFMVPFITPLFTIKRKGASHGQSSTHAPGPLYSILLAVWATVLAMEKRGKLLVARRGANRGLVIMTDRYPQNEILDFNDGPLLPRLTRVPLWLRRFEAGAYALARRLPPDLVIKLKVTPETAARREPNMEPTVIRKRIADVERLTFPGARIVCVNAEQPLSEVIRAVKREIWNVL